MKKSIFRAFDNDAFPWLKHKKDLVKQIFKEEEIDILTLQEIEIEGTFDTDILRIPGYSLETEIII